MAKVFGSNIVNDTQPNFDEMPLKWYFIFMAVGGVNRDPRQTFMACEGFVIYNDAIDQVMERLANEPLPTPEECREFIDYEWVAQEAKMHDCLSSSIGLHVVSKLLARQACVKDTRNSSRADHFNLSKQECKQVHEYTYYDGLDELDFTWIFSSVLASAAMQKFIQADTISRDEANSLQLSDWADIISSDWFSSLTRTLAHTGFGAYGGNGRFGDRIKDHRLGALEEQLNERAAQKFKLSQQKGEALAVQPLEGGFRGAKAVVTPAFSTLLIAMLRCSSKDGEPGSYYDFGGSIGCPVARHAAVLPADYETSMPRVLRLQAIGHLSIADKPDINGNFPATQVTSAIDRNLAFIASQLRTFHEQYGTPTIKF